MKLHRRFLSFVVLSALVGAALPIAVFAQGGKSASATKSNRIPIREFKLKNGLRVIMSEDHSAPTYAIAVTYNVGSRDERKGRTGFAHLFEHMMFQGSENVGKGEHFILIDMNGGEMKGTTQQEPTKKFP